MAGAHYMQVGDLLPVLEVDFTKADGTAFDFTAFASFTWCMEDAEGNVIASGVATSPSAGRLRYTWEAGDTDVAGTFLGSFRGTTADSKEQSFPTRGTVKVVISERKC